MLLGLARRGAFLREPARRRVPQGTRVYAIGDVHGRADLLCELHRSITEHAQRFPVARNALIYLGDLIDRGPESRSVIELLLDQPLLGFEQFHLRGNHDDCLARFLDHPGIGELWLSHGGNDTLRSYGVLPPRSLSDWREILRAQRQLREAMPRKHVNFFHSLRHAHVEGDYFFVHAGVRPGVALEHQLWEDLLWIGDEFLKSKRDHGKVIVHGHTVTATPVVRPNRIGIDTGAFVSGRLTCVVIQDDHVSFLQAAIESTREIQSEIPSFAGGLSAGRQGRPGFGSHGLRSG